MKRLAFAALLLSLGQWALATVPYDNVLVQEQAECPPGYTPNAPSYVWSKDHNKFVLEGWACRSIYRSPSNSL